MELFRINQQNELAAVNSLAKRIHGEVSSQKIIDACIDELKTLINPSMVMFFLYTNDSLELKGKYIASGHEWKSSNHPIVQCLCELAVKNKKIIYSSDIQGDLRIEFTECKDSRMSSLIALPLKGMGGIRGTLGVAYKNELDFHPIEDFFEALAWQVTSALDNALNYEYFQAELKVRKTTESELIQHHQQLENEVNQRTTELSTRNLELEREVVERKQAEQAEREQRAFVEALENTAASLNRTPVLEEVLDNILGNLKAVVPYDSANVMLIDDGGVAEVVRYKASTGRLSINKKPHFSYFNVDNTPTLNTMLHTLEPIVIPDVFTEPVWTPQEGSEWIGSFVASPIYTGDHLLGYLNLASASRNFYSSLHAERLLAFANHASIAIKNAQLFMQAREFAAVEERQRLSREMHDAVSQTLFTAAMIAEALPLQFARNPQKGMEGLSTLQRLTKGALAEMRTILLELRPEALVKADLGDLILQLGRGAMSYLEISLTSNLKGKFPLPEDVHIAIYRMAQEVFNNIVKHARATHVNINYENSDGYVYLQIADDGRGFSTGELRQDRLGLKIMRERAEEIGASLELSSKHDQGTTITIIWDEMQEDGEDD